MVCSFCGKEQLSFCHLWSCFQSLRGKERASLSSLQTRPYLHIFGQIPLEEIDGEARPDENGFSISP
jgi:hypothetical protein